MIEELKFLLDAMGNVDNIALYVLGGFALYKLVVYLSGVGAAVMLTKLLINKLHNAYTAPRPVPLKILDKTYDVQRICITNEADDRVIALLRRVAGKRTGISTPYIHAQSADWLEEAINEKERKDAKEKEKAND